MGKQIETWREMVKEAANELTSCDDHEAILWVQAEIESLREENKKIRTLLKVAAGDVIASRDEVKAIKDALKELVRLKDLKDSLGAAEIPYSITDSDDYYINKPKAWAEARRVLSPPIDTQT